MKRGLLALLVAELALAGCGSKDSPATPEAASTPQSSSSMPALAAPAEAPPPPGTAVAAAPVPSQAAEVPEYEGANETEKLTAALRDYYTRNGATAPAVTSLDALVKAGILKSVPAAPPGKKYVIDAATVEVRLVNK